MRKVRIATDDSLIILTDAPAEVIKEWIDKDAISQPANLGGGTYYAKVLYDYNIDTKVDPAIIGCDEIYDLYGHKRDDLLEWANTRVA